MYLIVTFGVNKNILVTNEARYFRENDAISVCMMSKHMCNIFSCSSKTYCMLQSKKYSNKIDYYVFLQNEPFVLIFLFRHNQKKNNVLCHRSTN